MKTKNYYTKKEMLKEVQAVMTGRSGHTHIFVSKRNGHGYDVETSIANDRGDDFDHHFQHCCNEISLREVERLYLDQIEPSIYAK